MLWLVEHILVKATFVFDRGETESTRCITAWGVRLACETSKFRVCSGYCVFRRDFRTSAVLTVKMIVSAHKPSNRVSVLRDVQAIPYSRTLEIANLPQVQSARPCSFMGPVSAE